MRNEKTASQEKIKVGVLGSTGLVGQQLLRLLDQHPFFEVALVAASEQSAGKAYHEAVVWQFPEEINPKIAALPVESNEAVLSRGQDISIFFSALPAGVALALEKTLRRAGKYVFSNASSHRLTKDVPLIIPEVNPEHLASLGPQKKKYSGFIVTNPNCVVAGLALGLKPLKDLEIKNLQVTTFQAISGAGLNGVSALALAGNVLPVIPEEETKIFQETRKILGQWSVSGFKPAQFDLIASCVRVPVPVGHLLSVVVELARPFDLDEIALRLATFRGLPQQFKLPTASTRPIVLWGEDNRPQPKFDSWLGHPPRARGMAIAIGRLRQHGQFLTFFLLVNNLVRGAAGAALLNAELALALELISPSGGALGKSS